MTTRLESLKVTADLDASAYTQGANQKVAADAKMVESSASVDAAVNSTQRVLGQGSSSIDRLARSLDPAVASQAAFTKAQNTINSALERGIISQMRANDLLDLASEKYVGGKVAVTALGDAHAFAGGKINDFREISRLTTDAVNGNVAGMVRSSAMLGNAYGLLGILLNPVVLATAALGAAFVATGVHASNLSAESNQLGVTITAMGQGAAISATQVQNLARQMESLGVSHADALKSITAGLRVPGASSSDIFSAAGLAPDFAAAYGVDITEATKKLTEMGASGYAAIKKLDDAYNFLTPDQAAHIHQLADEGKQADALAIAYQALADRTKDAVANSSTEMGKSILALKNAFRDLWDTISTGAVGQISVKLLTAAANDISHPSNLLQGPITDTVAPYAGLYQTLLGNPSQYLGSLLSGGRIANPYAAQSTAPINAGGPSVPFGGQVGTTASPAAAPAPNNSLAVKYINDETDAYNKQKEVLQANIGERTIVEARIKAEDDATQKNLVGKERDELLTLRQSAARDKLAQAANDNLVITRAETAGLINVADAYMKSSNAGIVAEATAKAQSEALKNSQVNVQALTQANLELAAAQTAVAGAKEVQALDLQTEAAKRLADAHRSGASAIADVTLKNKIDAATLNDRNAIASIANNTDQKSIDIRAQLNDEIRQTTQAITDEDTAQRTAAGADMIRSSQDQLTMAQAEFDLVGQTSVERASDLAIMQKKLEIENSTVVLTAEEKQKILDNVGAAAKLKAEAQEVDDITGKIGDSFAKSLTEGGKTGFAQLRQLARDTFAQIASEMVFRPIIQPIVASAVGMFSSSAASAAGSAAGGSLSDGASGLSIFSNLASLGKSFAGDIGNLFSAGGPLFTAEGTPAANMLEASIVEEGGTVAAAPSMFSMAGLGGLGAGFAAGSLLNGLVGGNQTNGMIGAGVGAAAGVALAALAPATLGLSLLAAGILGGSAGGVLGGLFGPGETAGPNGVAYIGETSPGRLGRTGAAADNGGDPSGVAGAVDSVASALNQLADAYNLTLHVNNPQGGDNAIVFGDGNSAPGVARDAPGIVQNLISTGSIVSSDPHIQAAISSSTAANLEQNLASVTALINLLKNVNDNGSIDPKPLTQTEQALAAINVQFAAFSAQAEQFGFSVEDIRAAGAKAIQAVTDGFNQSISDQLEAIINPEKAALDALQKAQDQRLDEAKAAGADLVQVEALSGAERAKVIEQFAGQATSSIQQFLSSITSGSSSPLSPVDTLANAQNRYNTLLSAAQGGDSSAISNITGAAQDLLNASRTSFASSDSYFQQYNFIKSTLTNLLGSAPGFATGGDFTVGGTGGTDSQMVRFWATPGERVSVSTPGSSTDKLGATIVRGFADLTQEVRAMRRDWAGVQDTLKRSNAYMQRIATKKSAA